ncbi:MAG TPA: XRE family transcriptional regulator [Candidatus Competibacteraceae bacterium]|nr:XRE family transcriptional regulator [Candidatus Competibacteraceae bacterium]
MNSASPLTAESALGQRLRALRSARGWTLEQTSQATGLARSTLSKIENGLMSPTYDALLKLADGLGVDVAELFAAPHQAMGSGRRSVCRRGQGQPHLTPYYHHELLCAELSRKRMMPFRSRVRARSFSEFEDWSRHQGEEFVYVLAGEIELHTECYQPVRLGPGDCFYIDSRMGHQVISIGPEDAEVLWISTHPQSLRNTGEPSP